MSINISSGHALRAALSFSVVTGKPLELEGILENRSEKGLSRDKLELVNVLAEGVAAKIEGNEENSTELKFNPQQEWHQRTINTSLKGAISLFFDGVLLPILLSGKRTTINIEGLTHPKNAPSLIFFKELVLRMLKPYIQRLSIEIEKDNLYPKKSKVKIVLEGKKFEEEIPKLNIVYYPELIALKAYLVGSNHDVIERSRSFLELGLQPKPIIHTTLVQGEGMAYFLSAFFGDEEGFDNDKPFVIGKDGLCKDADEFIDISKKFSDLKDSKFLDSYTTELLLPFLSFVGGSMPAEEITIEMQAIMDVAIEMLNVVFSHKDGILTCDGYSGIDEEIMP